MKGRLVAAAVYLAPAAGCYLSHHAPGDPAADASLADAAVRDASDGGIGGPRPERCEDLDGVWMRTFEGGCGVDGIIEGTPFPEEIVELRATCTAPGCDATNCEYVPSTLPSCDWHYRVEWPCSGYRNSFLDTSFRVIDLNHIEQRTISSLDGNITDCEAQLVRVR